MQPGKHETYRRALAARLQRGRAPRLAALEPAGGFRSAGGFALEPGRKTRPRARDPRQRRPRRKRIHRPLRCASETGARAVREALNFYAGFLKVVIPSIARNLLLNEITKQIPRPSASE